MGCSSLEEQDTNDLISRSSICSYKMFTLRNTVIVSRLCFYSIVMKEHLICYQVTIFNVMCKIISI